MTPAQAVIEYERARAGMVTTPQAEYEMQNGRDEIDAQDIAMQHAYHAWLATPEGQTAAQYARAYALHIAFDRGAEAAREEMEDNRSRR